MTLQDIRHAVRFLRGWRVGAAVAVATLAIGIGTTTSLYVFLGAVLGTARPHIEDIDHVGRIYASNRTLGVERAPLSLADFQSSLAGASSFESIAAYATDDRATTAATPTGTMSVGQVTENFFDVLRARAAAGRLMLPSDFRDGAPIVVVSDATWRTHFAGQRVGQATLVLDDAPWTVVGVLPPEFAFPFLGIGADVWTPMLTQSNPAARPVSVIARLTRDRTWTVAAAELKALALAQGSNALWTWRAIPVDDDVRTRAGSASALLLGPAFVVLLLGCVNVSCMLLARGIEREVELSVRCALGASPARIIRQLIAENLLLAGMGGTLGCAMAIGTLKVIASEMARFQPALAPAIAGDLAILPIVFAVSLVAAVLFGCLPAVRILRQDIASSLKGGTGPSPRFVGYHARDLVVFVELGLAVVLVVVAGMWLALFAELRGITPLFPADQIVAVNTPTALVSPLAEEIRSLSAVAGVAAASRLPGGRAPAAQVQAANGRSARAGIVSVQSTYFQTVGVPILRGRTFEPAEAMAGSGVVLVSEAVATALWPDEDPVGAALLVSGRSGTSRRIVIGVCRDALSLGSLAGVGLVAPDIYFPWEPGRTADAFLLVRTLTDAHTMLRPISVVARGSRAVVVGDEMRFVPTDSIFLVRLIGAVGLVALVLAATGIFGVLSQSVAQRTTEFGVRMALGASPADVLRMVILREAKLIVAAIATGALGTVVVTRAVFAELVAVSGQDVRLWVAVAVLCGGSAAVATAVATYRIVRLDPWTVLRKP